MSDVLLSVGAVAEKLGLHPKTVLRYIREGRLAAMKLGKAYRIRSHDMQAFADSAAGHEASGSEARTTAITELGALSVSEAERIASFVQAIAMTGDAGTSRPQVQTAFDPEARSLKIVAIGSVSDVGTLLQMLQIKISVRA